MVIVGEWRRCDDGVARPAVQVLVGDGAGTQLQKFDTDGAPITVGPVKFTSKGRVEKDYQTPYGVATVARHVYQSPQGGPTYCPLDRDARIVVSSTPRFAKVIWHKYAEFSSPQVQVDIKENHGREVSRCLIQDLADAVAEAALVKEEDWSYALPKFDVPAATAAISSDGTCTLMCDDDWREAMVGALAFYDAEREQRHTIYLAATPEYGRARFLGHLEAEIGRAKAKCPAAHYVGIPGGGLICRAAWHDVNRRSNPSCCLTRIDPLCQPAAEVVEDLLAAQLVEWFVEHLGIDHEGLVVRAQQVVEFAGDLRVDHGVLAADEHEDG
jgi:hypothetical protein